MTGLLLGRMPLRRGQEGSKIQRLCHHVHYYPKVEFAPAPTININSSIHYFKITELEKTATATEGQIPFFKHFNYQFFSINELKSNLKVLEKIYTTIKEDLQYFYLPIRNQNGRHKKKQKL